VRGAGAGIVRKPPANKRLRLHCSEFCWTSVEDQKTVLEHDNSIGSGGFVHVVGYMHHRPAFQAETVKNIKKAFPGKRTQHGSRLVEHKQGGIERANTCKSKMLLAPGRKRMNRSVGKPVKIERFKR
jgi:hypothetical protein